MTKQNDPRPEFLQERSDFQQLVRDLFKRFLQENDFARMACDSGLISVIPRCFDQMSVNGVKLDLWANAVESLVNPNLSDTDYIDFEVSVEGISVRTSRDKSFTVRGLADPNEFSLREFINYVNKRLDDVSNK